jgi:hypothetical protein
VLAHFEDCKHALLQSARHGLRECFAFDGERVLPRRLVGDRIGVHIQGFAAEASALLATKDDQAERVLDPSAVKDDTRDWPRVVLQCFSGGEEAFTEVGQVVKLLRNPGPLENRNETCAIVVVVERCWQRVGTAPIIDHQLNKNRSLIR